MARRLNPSILSIRKFPINQEINPECSLEGLTLKFQYFGHLMWRVDSLEKILMLGKIEGQRRRRWQRMWWLESLTDSRCMNLSKLWHIVKDRETWHAAVHEAAKGWTWLSNWTRTAIYKYTQIETELHTHMYILYSRIETLKAYQKVANSKKKNSQFKMFT